MLTLLRGGTFSHKFITYKNTILYNMFWSNYTVAK